MRTIFLLVFVSLRGLAQFSGLATTTDGSALYFSSTLRLRGSTESDAPKIFRHGAKFDLVEEVLRDNSIPDNTSNFYELIEPQVSGDGKIVAYTSTPECYNLPTVDCQVQYLPNVVGASHYSNACPRLGPCPAQSGWEISRHLLLSRRDLARNRHFRFCSRPKLLFFRVHWWAMGCRRSPMGEC